MEFKEYLILENRAYLGQKVGDILTASQELRDDSENMGTKDLVAYSTRIVSQIRRILHSEWNKEELRHLKTLQKVAVAIMKAIDEKNDLVSVIRSATAELEKLTSKIGVPLNKISGDDTSEPQDDKGVSEPTKGPPKKNNIKVKDQKVAPPQAAPPNSNPELSQGAPPLGNTGGPVGGFPM